MAHRHNHDAHQNERDHAIPARINQPRPRVRSTPRARVWQARFTEADARSTQNGHSWRSVPLRCRPVILVLDGPAASIGKSRPHVPPPPRPALARSQGVHQARTCVARPLLFVPSVFSTTSAWGAQILRAEGVARNAAT